MRIQLGRGSHLPVLMKLVAMTTGPILELGGGYCSTPFLHWACYPTGRRLVSYENNPDYYDFMRRYDTDFHTVHLIPDWTGLNVAEPWSIAFVDSGPEDARPPAIRQLVNAEYVVVHDTENKNVRRHNYREVFKLYRFHWRYNASPPTSVLSNRHDVTGFTIP